MATDCGYSSTDATLIAMAISELARNIVLYAKRGEIELASTDGRDRSGIVIVARDDGPGIADVSRASRAGTPRQGAWEWGSRSYGGW